ncbi:hypothetical protein E1A91_A05G126400v1 [Gossypium mustelinum]|uniref:Uncharacterized protein n=1 Tax=Gossypium mustelinum TaxID=34275 RepID=A0A5D2Z734_GOSMU|nr:hypothetical protein E1A91_A05G126400v1 [Gossypium mustelinum]
MMILYIFVLIFSLCLCFLVLVCLDFATKMCPKVGKICLACFGPLGIYLVWIDSSKTISVICAGFLFFYSFWTTCKQTTRGLILFSPYFNFS